MIMILFLGIFIMITAMILVLMENKSKILIGVNVTCLVLMMLTTIYCYNSSREFYEEKNKLKEIKEEIKDLEEQQEETSVELNIIYRTDFDLNKIKELEEKYIEIDEKLHTLINSYNEQTVKYNDLLKKDRKRFLLIETCIFEKEEAILEGHNHDTEEITTEDTHTHEHIENVEKVTKHIHTEECEH